MKDGFLKIGAVSPEIRTGDCEFNARSIISAIADAYMRGVRVLVLPELCVTGAGCGDLFLHSTLLGGAQRALESIITSTAGFDMICAVGAPIRANGKVRDCAVVFSKGEILGLVPKKNIPPSQRRFFEGDDKPSVFVCSDYPDLCIGIEVGEDIYAPVPPSSALAASGASLILGMSAEREVVGSADKRLMYTSVQSSRLCCAYALAGAGEGESTADGVFSGQCIIAENGRILTASRLFDSSLVTADIDLGAIAFERRKNFLFGSDVTAGAASFTLAGCTTELTRSFPRTPFVPEDAEECAERCSLIIKMQAAALAKRISHIGAKKAVIGISGGLDSTLALIACTEAMLLLHRPRTDIIAVTMPCFGTSARTRSNAKKLCDLFDASLREVDITESVKLHFSDISHDPELHNAAFENAQARERTQVLMDIANDEGGIVIGTGDLSELALGWATFAGDQISMYGVNASVPKTLIRRVVAHYADTCGDEALGSVLYDIVDTPVSPELLPADNGNMTQKTEDTVGPYELHDFFLYYMIRRGYSPAKLFRAACRAFDGEYDADTVKRWLKVFVSRFFTQQFKRSCQPDGPSVGSVSLSPRGGYDMPSDFDRELWMKELERLQ